MPKDAVGKSSVGAIRGRKGEQGDRAAASFVSGGHDPSRAGRLRKFGCFTERSLLDAFSSSEIDYCRA